MGGEQGFDLIGDRHGRRLFRSGLLHNAKLYGSNFSRRRWMLPEISDLCSRRSDQHDNLWRPS
jgi:hypothetical protein